LPEQGLKYKTPANQVFIKPFLITLNRFRVKVNLDIDSGKTGENPEKKGTGSAGKQWAPLFFLRPGVSFF
jgi:hypothetical protein